MVKPETLLTDHVAQDCAGALEVGFSCPERYNASDILFANLASGRTDNFAIHAASGSVTYGELCAMANQCGNALNGQSLAPFSRIMMVLDDTPVYPAAIFGAMRAGYVPILINTLSTADLVGYYLRDAAAEVAIVESDLCHLMTEETVRGTGLRLVVVANGPVPANLGVAAISWDEFISGAGAELVPADTHRDDMAFWMYSSGSTGRPKGIVHLHHDMPYVHACYGARVLNITEQDICFSPPKIFFAYGFGNSITYPFSVGAAAVLLAGRPTAEAVFDEIRQFKPTLFFALPTLYNSLMNSKAHQQADLGSVRMCLSAAETLSAELFAAWRARFGFEIVEGLGSTEILHMYLSNTADAKRPGAAGLRVPGYELKLLNADDRPAATGEDGILWVRGGSSAPCYWNKPDKTAETMRGDWIYTGDRFRRDEDGFYFFQGRADDLIKVSGQWVYPLEVEQCLADHPAVRECAVMGHALEDRRMTLKAFVALVDGVIPDDALNRELQDFVKTRLVRFKYPRIIEYLPELPKTGTGKIDRQKLLSAGTAN
ncbi:MAG: benzoate-CoA ligase family protein [Fimbriimonadaceae bacterium]|nr:benzoate-CoA ligase family protein [Alphaproteobacteria bacterium]